MISFIFLLFLLCFLYIFCFDFFINVAVAYVAVWNNNMTGPVLGSVPITLPTRDLGYTPITPNLQIARLDPAQIYPTLFFFLFFFFFFLTWHSYVIYFNVTSRSKYEVLTSYTANGGAGGFVKVNPSLSHPFPPSPILHSHTPLLLLPLFTPPSLPSSLTYTFRLLAAYGEAALAKMQCFHSPLPPSCN